MRPSAQYRRPGPRPPPGDRPRRVERSAPRPRLQCRRRRRRALSSSVRPPPIRCAQTGGSAHARLHAVHPELHRSLGRERLPVRVPLRPLRVRLPERVHPLRHRDRELDAVGGEQPPRRAVGRLQRGPHRQGLHGSRRARRGPREGRQRDHAPLHPLHRVQQLGGRDLLQPRPQPVHRLRAEPRLRDGARARVGRGRPDARGHPLADGLLGRHLGPQDGLPLLRQARRAPRSSARTAARRSAPRTARSAAASSRPAPGSAAAAARRPAEPGPRWHPETPTWPRTPARSERPARNRRAAGTVTLGETTVVLAAEGTPPRTVAYRDLAVLAIADGDRARRDWRRPRRRDVAASSGSARLLGPLVATLRERRLRQRLADAFVDLPDGAAGRARRVPVARRAGRRPARPRRLGRHAGRPRRATTGPADPPGRHRRRRAAPGGRRRPRRGRAPRIRPPSPRRRRGTPPGIARGAPCRGPPRCRRDRRRSRAGPGPRRRRPRGGGARRRAAGLAGRPGRRLGTDRAGRAAASPPSPPRTSPCASAPEAPARFAGSPSRRSGPARRRATGPGSSSPCPATWSPSSW